MFLIGDHYFNPSLAHYCRAADISFTDHWIWFFYYPVQADWTLDNLQNSPVNGKLDSKQRLQKNFGRRVQKKRQSSITIAGHWHRGRCCRHWHSGILYFSTVPEHSGTRLSPLILVRNCFRHQHFCTFRYRTDRDAGPSSIPALIKTYALHVHTAGGGKGYCFDKKVIGPEDIQ
jgi:hypothetical protein